MTSKYLSNDEDAYELDDPKHPTWAERQLERADTRRADSLGTEPSAFAFTVLTADGRQFSIAQDRTTADKRAAQIGGSVVPYVPNPSSYWAGNGANYDH